MTGVHAPFDQVCRYLGCRGEVEPALAGRIRALTQQAEEAAQPRTASRIFPLSFPGGDRLALGPLAVESAALRKNLAGCEEVILFAATLPCTRRRGPPSSRRYATWPGRTCAGPGRRRAGTCGPGSARGTGTSPSPASGSC